MTLRQITLSAAIVLFASTLGAGAAQAQANLKIDGILGEATEASHKDEIAVASYSYGAELAVGPAGGAGAAVGKSSFEAFVFTHGVDRASTSLMLALAKGQHIKSAVLTVHRPGASEFLRVTFTDARVKSVKTSGSGHEVSEEVTLVYAKIQVEYFMTGRDGKVGPGTKMTWDVVKNTGA